MADFVGLVRQMRASQKTYYKTRNHNDLIRCKQLEKRVDVALEKLNVPMLDFKEDADGEDNGAGSKS